MCCMKEYCVEYFFSNFACRFCSYIQCSAYPYECMRRGRCVYWWEIYLSVLKQCKPLTLVHIEGVTNAENLA